MIKKRGYNMINKRFTYLFTKVLLATFLLSACNFDNSPTTNRLEKGAVYTGENATSEIVKVDSNDSWTIKSRHQDDTNYTIVSVTDTDEEIADFPVITLKSTEVIGNINSSFSKREGRDFIMIKDGSKLYFRSISDENRDSIQGKLKKEEDKKGYLEGISNYQFNNE